MTKINNKYFKFNNTYFKQRENDVLSFNRLLFEVNVFHIELIEKMNIPTCTEKEYNNEFNKFYDKLDSYLNVLKEEKIRIIPNIPLDERSQINEGIYEKLPIKNNTTPTLADSMLSLLLNLQRKIKIIK